MKLMKYLNDKNKYLVCLNYVELCHKKIIFNVQYSCM